MLDSGGPLSGRTRWSVLCRRPVATLVTCEESGWDALRALLPPRQAEGALPFQGGLVGMASYGAGLKLEKIPSAHADDTPHLVAGLFADALVFDRQDKRLYWSSLTNRPPPELPSCTRRPAAPPVLPFRPDLDATQWIRAVDSVRDYIAAGDLFQANLTVRFHASRPAGLAVVDLYRALRKSMAAPFGGLLKSPGFSLLSGSVERFLSMDAQGRIETRPIKGTAPLGPSEAENRAIALALAGDEKEYAENLMITDLMRNDIGRVSQLGSVTVPELCQVERFAHWHHLVSCVRSIIRPGLDAIDLLRATLPPGSVTGAPKHRAMQIIDTIERSARGAYCGSFFRIGFDGALDSSVIIRTLAILKDRLEIGTGGGITYPSDPAREYEEMRLKAAPLLSLFDP